MRTIDIMPTFTSGLTTYIQSESSSITCTESALHMLQVCKADLEYSCTKQGNSKHNMNSSLETRLRTLEKILAHFSNSSRNYNNFQSNRISHCSSVLNNMVFYVAKLTVNISSGSNKSQ